MLAISEQWMKWAGMSPKVEKCQSMAIEASTGRVYDPALTLAGERISFVGSQPVKFLGGIIELPSNQARARICLQEKLTTLLDRVDLTPVTGKQKLHLFKLGICPRLTWDLTITEFPVSWMEKSLDPLVTKYLKQWSGLARPAETLLTMFQRQAGVTICIRPVSKTPSREGCPFDDLQRRWGPTLCEETVGERSCCTKNEVQAPVICAASFLPRPRGLTEVPYDSSKEEDDGG